MLGGSEIVVSPETLLLLLVAVLYAPATLLAYRAVLPGLSPPAKAVAAVTLAAQLLVILVAIVHEPESHYMFWLFHLDLEWNIPSALSSTQLALAGSVALAAAWTCRGQTAWKRAHLAALGVFFLLLGLEEFFAWKEALSENAWRLIYAILGAAVFIASALVAARTPKAARAWLGQLLAGMALIGFGGFVIDGLPEVCGSVGFMRIDGCVYLYRSPEEIIEFLGGWIALLALLGSLSRSLPPAPSRLRWLPSLFPLFWLPVLLYFSPVNQLEVEAPAQAASVQYESNAQLHGFQLNSQGLPKIALMFFPYDADVSQLGLSIHLVDQVSGESLASREVYASRRYAVWPGGRGYEPVFAQAIDVAMPPDAPTNRALWVVLSHWHEIGDRFVQQRVVDSSLRQLNQTQVILGELALPDKLAASASAPLAAFDNGFALSQVEGPDRAARGSIQAFTFAWRAEETGAEDYTQFLHFANEETGAQWGHDQPPLGARLPTRLWYSGMSDRETWSLPIPADLAPGKYAVSTGLYRASDLQRVPARKPDGEPYMNARVPLGSLIIQ